MQTVPEEPGEPASPSGAPNSIPESASEKRTDRTASPKTEVWWIYNNLPYAESLENGNSDKAPDGVINLALAAAEADIDTRLETMVLAKNV